MTFWCVLLSSEVLNLLVVLLNPIEHLIIMRLAPEALHIGFQRLLTLCSLCILVLFKAR